MVENRDKTNIKVKKPSSLSSKNRRKYSTQFCQIIALVSVHKIPMFMVEESKT